MRSKKIQSTYLNNCSLACVHTRTYKSIHFDRAALNNMHTSPVLASPLVLHSREQMFGDSLQPQRISVYKANSSTQHFWLQWEMCSWSGGRGGLWVTVRYHEDGWRGAKRVRRRVHARWNCVKVTSGLHRKVPPISCAAVCRSSAGQHPGWYT